ncbi:hypothetical protein EE612_002492 [Oryza sativa]|jgi:hypothetical protein|nr:hypothetical protein EE612_002492 [Oryza sativa]
MRAESYKQGTNLIPIRNPQIYVLCFINLDFVSIEDIKFVLEMINTNWMAMWDIKNIIQAPHQHMAMIKRGLLET